MASVFSKIISGEIPSFKIDENDQCIAFLDVNPLTKGHVLVVPKTEVDLLFDLEQIDYEAVHAMAKLVAKAIQKALDCKRVGSAVIGLEVPHAHVHLVPINTIGDLDFTKSRAKFSKDELRKTAEEIRNFL